MRVKTVQKSCKKVGRKFSSFSVTLIPSDHSKGGLSISPTQKQLDNLKKGAPYRFTKENASEKGRRGAKASHEAHKRKKDMYTMTRKVADTSVKSEDLRKVLEDLGLDDEEQINAALIVKGVFERAAAGIIPASTS